MRISTVAVLALALTLMGTAAMAQEVASSSIGLTGLVVAPTAHVVPEEQLLASFSWIDTDDSSTTVWSGTLGLGGGLEAGIAHLRNGSSETIGNLKYNVNLARLTNNPGAPELAIGVWDLTDQLDRAYYIVMTDTFGAEWANARWSIGIGDSDGDILNGLFGGAELALSPRSIAQIDYDGDSINAAYRHRLADQLSAGIGLVDGDLGVNVSFQTPF